jgi:hypothetical protein
MYAGLDLGDQIAAGAVVRQMAIDTVCCDATRILASVGILVIANANGSMEWQVVQNSRSAVA